MNASHIGCQNQANKGYALGDSRKTGHPTCVQVLQETLVIWSLAEVELEGIASEVSEEDYSWPFRCVFNKKPAQNCKEKLVGLFHRKTGSLNLSPFCCTLGMATG